MNASAILLTKSLVYSHAQQYKWHRCKTLNHLEDFLLTLGTGHGFLACGVSHSQDFPAKKGMTNNLYILIISPSELILVVHGYTDLLE